MHDGAIYVCRAYWAVETWKLADNWTRTTRSIMLYYVIHITIGFGERCSTTARYEAQSMIAVAHIRKIGSGPTEIDIEINSSLAKLPMDTTCSEFDSAIRHYSPPSQCSLAPAPA